MQTTAVCFAAVVVAESRDLILSPAQQIVMALSLALCCSAVTVALPS
eukprot:COSAG06_NODE_33853_length_481_cov_1.132812_1_plen_46_part_01